MIAKVGIYLVNGHGDVMIYLDRPIMVHSESWGYCHLEHHHQQGRKGRWWMSKLILLNAMVHSIHSWDCPTVVSELLSKHIFNIVETRWNVSTLSL